MPHPDVTPHARTCDALRHALLCARCLPASGTRDALRVRLRAELAAALEGLWQVAGWEEGRRGET